MNTSFVLEKVAASIHSEQEYDYFAIHQERYRIILEKIQDLAKGKKLKILDIGCFPYHVGRGLELLGHDMYGIASGHEPVQNKKIKIINIETEKFPFRKNFFDMVLCNEVLEHLPHSPLPPLFEVKRVLKSEGVFMMTTPNIARSINRFKLFVGRQIMYPISVFSENRGLGNNIYHRHNREYILSEVLALLKTAGLILQESGYFISYTPNRKKRVPDSAPLSFVKWVNYGLMLMMPSLQDTLMVIGKKN